VIFKYFKTNRHILGPNTSSKRSSGVVTITHSTHVRTNFFKKKAPKRMTIYEDCRLEKSYESSELAAGQV